MLIHLFIYVTLKTVYYVGTDRLFTRKIGINNLQKLVDEELM